jgi:hypothetical protein
MPTNKIVDNNDTIVICSAELISTSNTSVKKLLIATIHKFITIHPITIITTVKIISMRLSIFFIFYLKNNMNVDIFIASTISPIEPVKNIFAQSNVTVIDYDNNEYNFVIDAFSRTSDDKYVILCYNSVATSSTSETIFNILNTVIELSKTSNKFDVFYLSKYADYCQKYNSTVDINNTGLKFVMTTNPNGMICVMFSPSGIKKLNKILPSIMKKSKNSFGHELTKLVQNDNDFIAASTSPSLLQYNIFSNTELNNLENNYIKTIECMYPNYGQKPPQNLTIFWIVVVLIVVVLVMYLIVKYTHSNNIDNITNVVS